MTNNSLLEKLTIEAVGKIGDLLGYHTKIINVTYSANRNVEIDECLGPLAAEKFVAAVFYNVPEDRYTNINSFCKFGQDKDRQIINIIFSRIHKISLRKKVYQILQDHLPGHVQWTGLNADAIFITPDPIKDPVKFNPKRDDIHYKFTVAQDDFLVIREAIEDEFVYESVLNITLIFSCTKEQTNYLKTLLKHMKADQRIGKYLFEPLR